MVSPVFSPKRALFGFRSKRRSLTCRWTIPRLASQQSLVAGQSLLTLISTSLWLDP